MTERQLIFRKTSRNKMKKNLSYLNFISKTKPEGSIKLPYSGKKAAITKLARTERCCPSKTITKNPCRFLITARHTPRRYI